MGAPNHDSAVETGVRDLTVEQRMQTLAEIARTSSLVAALTTLMVDQGDDAHVRDALGEAVRQLTLRNGWLADGMLARAGGSALLSVDAADWLLQSDIERWWGES